MNSTALGAENTKKESIIFISEAHEKFYYEKLEEVRYQDVYHKALCYCLGINDDTRRNANRIYDFKTGCVKTECLHEGWQISGSVKVVRMAFNLYCNAILKIFVSMPSYKTKQVDEHGKPIYQDVCYPVTKDFREKLYDEIIPEYEKAKDKSNEKARENAEKNHGNPDKDKDKEATPFR